MQTGKKTIIREGYHRKGYDRSGYVTKSGVKVPPTHVKPTDVPAARIQARGKAAVTGHKGKKLINMSDERHLANYGYSLSESAPERHKALRKASAAEGYNWPIRRLNAVSTLTRNTVPTKSARAHTDMQYVQGLRDKSRAK